jgi:hypothetical protein
VTLCALDAGSFRVDALVKEPLFMKCKRLTSGIIVLLAIGICQPVFGDDSRVATQPISLVVAGSALLGISGPPVSLQLGGATQAGAPIKQGIENKDTRLRISSLVNEGETRAITAKISEELVGTQLYVSLEEPNTHFTYPENKGVLKESKLLSNASDATLVEGIGTCWSGVGEDDGYVIRYSYKAIPNAPVLKSASITVTYTISLVPSDGN